jgi:DNA helicase HerA-like ATPase
MLDIADLMQTADGKGVINILAADKLMNNPRLYSTFLLWLLSELFENLPEVGDRDKPKLVFFFDEAHLLFSEAPQALLEKVEQVVRLIRSKGVGVYFVTQNPIDIPDKVLGQLGNRVQHALRAFTPRDQKAVKAAAETMRANPKLDTEKAITELGVGEALVSFLDAKGAPGVTERAWVLAPGSQLGPITPEERKKLIRDSLVAGTYDKAVDRESAYEQLRERAGGGTTMPAGKGGAAAEPAAADAGGGGVLGGLGDILFGSTGPRGGRREGMVEAAAKSAARSVGSSLAREITRGVLGSLLGGSRRRR